MTESVQKKKTKTYTKDMLREIYDPLREEEKLVAGELHRGMEAVLNLHNPAELASLCGAMGLLGKDEELASSSHNEMKIVVLTSLADQAERERSIERAYMGVLTMIWEGILFEYLRSQGEPLRTCRQDPRRYTLHMWRKRAAALPRDEATGVSLFEPRYLPRLVRNRGEDPNKSDDIMKLLMGIETHEIAVKCIEKKIRTEADYRNVVRYLAESAKLHNSEREARDYLIHKLEIARAKIEHEHISLEMSADQQEALEERHDRITSYLVAKLASAEARLNHVSTTQALTLAIERQQLARLLKAILATPGPADGIARLVQTTSRIEEDEVTTYSKTKAESAEEQLEASPTLGLTAEDTIIDATRSQSDDSENSQDFCREATAASCLSISSDAEDFVRSAVEARMPISNEPSWLCSMVAKKYSLDLEAAEDRWCALDAASSALQRHYADAAAMSAAREAQLRIAHRKHQQLATQLAVTTEHAALAVALPRAELEQYRNSLAKAYSQLARYDAGVANAGPAILSMLHMNDNVTVSRAAEAALQLELLPSAESIRENIERGRMEREEVQRRIHIAVYGPTPKFSRKVRSARRKKRIVSGKKKASAKKKKGRIVATTSQKKSKQKSGLPVDSKKESVGKSSKTATATSKKRSAAAIRPVRKKTEDSTSVALSPSSAQHKVNKRRYKA